MASAHILGLDIGEKRIGVALADARIPFPSPLTTLEASGELATQFAALLKKYHVVTVVVGYPRNQQGQPTAQTQRVEQIVTLLNIPTDVSVAWQDESLTSVKAEEELKRRGGSYQKGDIDALAATYILNDYITSSQQVVANQPPPKDVVVSQKAAKKSTPHKEVTKNTSSKKSRSPFLLVAIALATATLLAVFISVAWYIRALGPRTANDVYHVVKIQQGATTQQIAAQLDEAGVIKSARVFGLYVRLNGITNLQAGSYRLSSGKSVSEIATIIADGKVTTANVLIAPGLRLSQIKQTLVTEGYSEDDIDAAIKAARNHPLLAGYPASARLEGYLYPETYQVEPDTTAKELVVTILDTFNKAITPDIRSGIAKQGLTLPQAINLASIVQKEVSDPVVQRTVAQVFISRLNQGMVLGSDVTYKYAAAQFGTIDNPSSNSPYNTRKFAGLPPTPIANFNLSALKAVANPTNTSYIYFVAGDDGTTHFAHTLEQHEANVAKYCKKGCG